MSTDFSGHHKQQQEQQEQQVLGLQLLDLPDHIIISVLGQLGDVVSLCSAARSCRQLWALAGSPPLWTHAKRGGPVERAVRGCVARTLRLPRQVLSIQLEPKRSRKFPVTVPLFNLRGVLGSPDVEELASQLSTAMQARIARLPLHRTQLWLPAHGTAAPSSMLFQPQSSADGAGVETEPHVWPLPPLSLLMTCRPDRGTVRLQLRPAAVLPLSYAHIAAQAWPPVGGQAAAGATGVQGAWLPLTTSSWFPGVGAWGAGESFAPGQETSNSALTGSVAQVGAVAPGAEHAMEAGAEGQAAPSAGTAAAAGANSTRMQWCALQRRCFAECSTRLAACPALINAPAPFSPGNGGNSTGPASTSGGAPYGPYISLPLTMPPASNATPTSRPPGSSPLPADGRPAPSLQAVWEEVERLLGVVGVPPSEVAVLQGAVMRLVALCAPASPYASSQEWSSVVADSTRTVWSVWALHTFCSAVQHALDALRPPALPAAQGQDTGPQQMRSTPFWCTAPSLPVLAALSGAGGEDDVVAALTALEPFPQALLDAAPPGPMGQSGTRRSDVAGASLHQLLYGLSQLDLSQLGHGAHNSMSQAGSRMGATAAIPSISSMQPSVAVTAELAPAVVMPSPAASQPPPAPPPVHYLVLQLKVVVDAARAYMRAPVPIDLSPLAALAGGAAVANANDGVRSPSSDPYSTSSLNTPQQVGPTQTANALPVPGPAQQLARAYHQVAMLQQAARVSTTGTCGTTSMASWVHAKRLGEPAADGESGRGVERAVLHCCMLAGCMRVCAWYWWVIGLNG